MYINTTFVLLVCALTNSDIIAFASFIVSTLTLWFAYKVYSVFAKQQILAKQIEAVYKLIEHLHNDSFKLSFSALANNGSRAENITLNVFEVSHLSKSDFRNNYNNLPICFGKGSNQILDMKSFIQNPFIPKSISDELVNFYSVDYDIIDTKEIKGYDELECIVISNKYDENVFTNKDDEISSKYKQSSVTALKDWESLKECSKTLEKKIKSWLLNHGIKQEDVNIRADFINKPKKE